MNNNSRLYNVTPLVLLTVGDENLFSSSETEHDMHAADKRFLVLIDVLNLQPPERLHNCKISEVFVNYICVLLLFTTMKIMFLAMCNSGLTVY